MTETKRKRKRYRTPEDAFLGNSEQRGDCVVWTGYVTKNGYGRIWNGKTTAYAHRFSWERTHGPIPDGLMVDHICHNRACVRVEHLRLATNQQNSWHRRGANPNSATGIRGVSYHSSGAPMAQVKVGGRVIQVLTDTLEEAEAAVKALHREHYGEFAGG